jgi:hypothetical protein
MMMELRRNFGAALTCGSAHSGARTAVASATFLYILTALLTFPLFPLCVQRSLIVVGPRLRLSLLTLPLAPLYLQLHVYPDVRV